MVGDGISAVPVLKETVLLLPRLVETTGDGIGGMPIWKDLKGTVLFCVERVGAVPSKLVPGERVREWAVPDNGVQSCAVTVTRVIREMVLVTVRVAIRSGLLVWLPASPASDVAHEVFRLIVVWVAVDDVGSQWPRPVLVPISISRLMVPDAEISKPRTLTIKSAKIKKNMSVLDARNSYRVVLGIG